MTEPGLMKACYKRLTSPDRRVRQKAARAWSISIDGVCAHFVRPRRLIRSAIVLKPQRC